MSAYRHGFGKLKKNPHLFGCRNSEGISNYWERRDVLDGLIENF